MLKLLLGAALVAGQAQAAPNPARCITRDEVGNLTLVGASIAVEMVRGACRPYLPATAFLATPAGAAFSGRLREEAERRLDSAIDGVARLSSTQPDVPRAALRTFVRGMMAEGAGAELVRQVDASLCSDANEIMEIASTLSPDQMARFVGAFASIADHVARMRPMQMPARIVPQPARPEGAPPSPHPAAFETTPTGVPPPVVVVPVTPAPGSSAAHRPPRPALTPFMCRPAQ
jgi:hypothetical protein